MTRIFAAISLIAIPLLVFPQPKIVIRPTIGQAEFPDFHGAKLTHTPEMGRPKVGLVLSGGGARGLAQIGVLRVLEKHHIPIDAIVGNSFGSVIGGLYAAGYSPYEIESIATHTNWSELLSFSEETKRTDLFVGQKQWQQEGFLVIRFDGLQPVIPSSLSGGQRLSNFFSYLTLQALYHPHPSFDDLEIPFRATATDLYSGKRIVMDRGSLSEAMRASVTVPLLYTPLEIDSMLLVDGGLVSNIPVDIAKSLGCDVVIVVNSTSSLRKSSQLNAPWEIADQIMTIMMQESNRRQLESADVVITPEAGERIVSDFSGVDTLIAAGVSAAERSIPHIAEVLENHSTHASLLSTDPSGEMIVSFEGDPLPNDEKEAILGEAHAGTLSLRRIQTLVDRIYSSGVYDDLYAEVTEHASPATLIVHASRYPAIRQIMVTGNNLISSDSIRHEADLLSGRSCSPVDVQDILEKTVGLYRRKGYSLARVESVDVDRSQGVLNLKIDEGRIGQIKYEGNERTRDYIIRREFPLDEGEVFDIERAYRGIVNIKSTGLFEYVLLNVRYEENRPALVLIVKERSSELLRLGIHADNEHNLTSMIDIRDANFRGAWEDLGVTFRYGSRERFVLGGYRVNRIFHSYLTANLSGYYKSHDIITYTNRPDLFPERWERIEAGSYREDNYGWSLAFGSHFPRFGDVTAELRGENQRIVSLTGQGYIPEKYRLVALKFQSIIDTEDKSAFPTSGNLLSLSYESALKTLGGEVAFTKLAFSYETYLTVLPRHTLRPKINFGFADETLPLAEQFSLGGFDSFYGLRDDDSRGRQIFLVNFEYRFRLPFKILFETYLKARYDLGTISSVPEQLKLNTFRHGVGMEIALDSPLGQMSIGMGKSFYFRQDLPNFPVSTGPLLIYFSLGPSL